MSKRWTKSMLIGALTMGAAVFAKVFGFPLWAAVFCGVFLSIWNLALFLEMRDLWNVHKKTSLDIDQKILEDIYHDH